MGRSASTQDSGVHTTTTTTTNTISQTNVGEIGLSNNAAVELAHTFSNLSQNTSQLVTDEAIKSQQISAANYANIIQLQAAQTDSLEQTNRDLITGALALADKKTSFTNTPQNVVATVTPNLSSTGPQAASSGMLANKQLLIYAAAGVAVLFILMRKK